MELGKSFPFRDSSDSRFLKRRCISCSVYFVDLGILFSRILSSRDHLSSFQTASIRLHISVETSFYGFNDTGKAAEQIMDVEFYAISVLVQDYGFSPPIFVLEAVSNISFCFSVYPVELLQWLFQNPPFVVLFFKSQVSSHFICNCLISQCKSFQQKAALSLIDLNVVLEYHQRFQTPQNFSYLPELLHHNSVNRTTVYPGSSVMMKIWNSKLKVKI